MLKWSGYLVVVLFFFQSCFADTFINIITGEKFNGYATHRKKAELTQVNIEGRASQYLNLRRYKIRRDALGRNNEVHIFSLNNPLDITAEVTAFEKSLVTAANRGPIFILIEIDLSSGRTELLERVCEAIMKIKYCDTVSFVGGRKIGGAFSKAVTIALACNKVYMKPDSGIGSDRFSVEEVSFERLAQGREASTITQRREWLEYSLRIAGLNKRPVLLVKAMLDEKVKLVEVAGEDKKVTLISLEDKTSEQEVLAVRCEQGELLKLTAVEAVKYGTADGLAGSRGGLINKLAGAKVRLINDRAMSAARRKFEGIQRRMNDITASIREIETREAALSEELKELEKAVSHRDSVVVFDGDDLQYQGLETYDSGFAVIERDEVLDGMIIVLENLIRQYDQAISLAEANPDLQQDPADLSKGLESARLRYRLVRTKLRLRY
ncbi:MAG: Clp protease/crotonase-like domain-containing protein [Planctomycetota bacterium]|jgi:membrane-bound ClpP family serine protease